MRLRCERGTGLVASTGQLGSLGKLTHQFRPLKASFRSVRGGTLKSRTIGPCDKDRMLRTRCTTLIATISKDNKKGEIGNTGATEPKIRIDVRGT